MNNVPARLVVIFFCFNDTATTEIYTLSLHDALPIYGARWAGEKLLHGHRAAVHAVSRNRGAHRLPAGGSVAGLHRGAVSAPEVCQGAGRLPTTPLLHSAGSVLRAAPPLRAATTGLGRRPRGTHGDDSGALRPFDHRVSDQAL